MNAQRCGNPQGCAEIVAVQSLLVDAMTRLMQRAEERSRKMPLVVARRQAAVPRTDSVAERMRRFIQPARIEVKPDRLRRPDGERPLRIDGIPPLENRDIRLATRRRNSRYELHQVIAQRPEHALN